ncbi:hypothetical protein AXF42_Ash007638 [Apostasia shenzhenica]|uniref:Uncharacterized protein n=1 Tax=Apostasia shenzhenica TaxID=1088818 RepID=A0A2I0A626_9ASPA|nr:hypothetical protein AXF42_Ash007638 [Apostasia shenzhenica]
MTPRAVNPRQAIEACTLQLHAWKPFQIHSLPFEPPKPDSFRSKKPCRSDRSTAPPLSIDGLDLTRLSLVEEPLLPKAREERGFRWLAVARKRRRRGSRSVSGRSSDRSGTWRQAGGGGGSVAYATCSDFPIVAGGTDSSGEFFVSGDGSWASDVSEARVWRKDGREGGGGGLEREGLAFGSYPAGLDSQGNESGYGSEPGYRGDGEFGYGDELDEEDEDGKQLFWGGGLGGMITWSYDYMFSDSAFSFLNSIEAVDI